MTCRWFTKSHQLHKRLQLSYSEGDELPGDVFAVSRLVRFRVVKVTCNTCSMIYYDCTKLYNDDSHLNCCAIYHLRR